MSASGCVWERDWGVVNASMRVTVSWYDAFMIVVFMIVVDVGYVYVRREKKVGTCITLCACSRHG